MKQIINKLKTYIKKVSPFNNGRELLHLIILVLLFIPTISLAQLLDSVVSNDYYLGKLEVSNLEKYGDITELNLRAFTETNDPIGFGKYGDIEYEHFIIKNMPTLVPTGFQEPFPDPDNPKNTLYIDSFIQDENKALELVLSQAMSVKEQLLANSTTLIQGSIGNTTYIIYPDMDGACLRDTPEIWSNKYSGTGTDCNISDVGTGFNIAQIYDGGGSASWDTITRGYFGFDTSIIGTDTVDSGTISFYGHNKTDSYNSDIVIDLVTTTREDALVTGDYDVANFDDTLQSDTRIDITAFSTTGYNDFVLNTTGISNIDKTGLTFYSLRHGRDFDNSEPVQTNANDRVLIYMSEQAGTTNDPKLVLEVSSTTPEIETSTSSTSTDFITLHSDVLYNGIVLFFIAFTVMIYTLTTKARK